MVHSREEFIEYCLRKLGAPVVEINLAESQISDRIDEALEYFRVYHWDGVEKVYLKHQVTQEDIDNQFIELPDLIYGVTKVYKFAAGSSSSKSIFDLQYQLRLNDLYDLTSTSIIYYSQTMMHLQLLDNILNGAQPFRFNRINNKLYIEASWGANELALGAYILTEAYRALDPDEAHNIWNDIWLKHYATALLKKNWGSNLKKFDGMQLPGGITVNGQALYEEAIQEIEKLEQELIEKQAPLQMVVG